MQYQTMVKQISLDGWQIQQLSALLKVQLFPKNDPDFFLSTLGENLQF